MISQEFNCPLKIHQGHLLVEAGKDFRMNRLKTKRYFQLSLEAISKLQAIIITQAGMIFDDRSLAGRQAISNPRPVLPANRSSIKKISTVI